MSNLIIKSKVEIDKWLNQFIIMSLYTGMSFYAKKLDIYQTKSTLKLLTLGLKK